jgi:hypothetical protein
MRRSKARYKAARTQSDIIALAGFNNTENHNEKQLLDMLNISSNEYPFITQRPPREQIETLPMGGKYLFASDVLCWVDGSIFYYGGVSKGALANDPTSIVEMNNFIVIFPDEDYYDKVNDTWGSFTSGYDINYATVNDNRMFAVSGNQLIASKQGDFKTWDSFQGISTDSFAADVATQGDFIGLVTFQDHVTMFKDDNIHELYGNMPSNYTIPEALKTGCVDARTAAELDGILMFMSQDGIYSYSGGLPRKISNEVDVSYEGGVAATSNGKYYVSLYNGTDYSLFVYDGRYKEWYKEDDLQVTHFAKLDGILYALTADNKILQFNSGSEMINWEIETNVFDQMIFEKKSYRELLINIELEYGSTAILYIKKDNLPYELIKSMTDAKQRHFRIPINLSNCNSFQFKITGKGEFTLKNIRRTFDLGGRINV